MRTVQFISYKIASIISLDSITGFFRLPLPESWEDCVILGEQQLAEVYKFSMPSKKIFIFQFGCVTFENFHSDEVSEFLQYLHLIIGNLDYKMLARYNESHTILLSDALSVSLLNESSRTFPFSASMVYMIAVVLAKSAALSKIETDVDLLLDEAENFIAMMSSSSAIPSQLSTILSRPFVILNTVKNLIARPQNGISISITRKYASTMAHIVKFEYDTAVGIKIFDRPAETNRDQNLRSAYDELSNYYELEDRYEVLQKKVGELRSISRSYSTLRYWRQENRLILFEVFLLILFPLSYLVRALLH